jgi:hypothetical protein
LTYLLVPLVVVLVPYLGIARKRVGLAAAAPLFALLEVVMAAGILPQLDPANPADRLHGWIVLATLTILMAASGLVLILQKPPTNEAPDQPLILYRPSRLAWMALWVALVVVVAYYAAVGSSALITGVADQLSGGRNDIAGIRLSAYSGGQYLFPGYVNQFKNSLLPAISLVVIAYWFKSGHRRMLASVGLVAFSTLGLLGTGQRGHFLIMAAIAAVFLVRINGGRLSRKTAAMGVFAIFALVVTTAALGRSTSLLPSDAGFGERLAAAAGELSHRVFVDEEESAVYGFRYIYDQQPQWGGDWAASAAGLLPGTGGSDLSNRIYESMFGTPRGTAPPSLWGSAYYNFGMVGIVALPLLLGVFLSRLSIRGTVTRPRNTMEVMGISGTFVTLAFWVADTPVAPLNIGLGVYLGLWWWGRSALNRSEHGGQAVRVPQVLVKK